MPKKGRHKRYFRRLLVLAYTVSTVSHDPLTSTSSGSDHAPSLYWSRMCELVGRNSKPKSSQGVSSLAVPGAFLAVADMYRAEEAEDEIGCCCIRSLAVSYIVVVIDRVVVDWKASQETARCQHHTITPKTMGLEAAPLLLLLSARFICRSITGKSFLKIRATAFPK